MAVRTVVHLMRHGEVFNPSKILYGRLPGFFLSPLGEEMAEVVAESLKTRDITYLVSSPLERAQQTAKPISEKLNLDVVLDRNLIEAENVFEGQRVAVGDGALRKPSAWRHLYNPFKPSWGEPYVLLAARMKAAIDAARHEARGHEAVLVSHQLPIWIARLEAEKKRFIHDPRKRECSLASLTSLHFDDDELVDIQYSEPAAHLLLRSNRGVGA
jgi:broad specificity phosphatase PhoE